MGGGELKWRRSLDLVRCYRWALVIVYLYILCILCCLMSEVNPDPLGFLLSQADSRPMYLQIMDQVQQRVAAGDWQPGNKLPSIRELAVEAKVSVITVKRAYLELERNGLIVTQQGKGSWVAEGVDRDQLQMAELEQLLQRVVGLAQAVGLSPDELRVALEDQLRAAGGSDQ